MSTMSTACYLDLLAPELKGLLLKYCDGSSVLALCSLSESWNEFILNYDKGIWWRICSEEMEVDSILDIMLSLYPKLWLGDKVYWIDIYSSWQKWRSILNNCVLYKRTVYNTVYEITSVAFSGSWIFVGTREGQLGGVNINIGVVVVISNQCGAIYDIQLRRTSMEEIDGPLTGCEHDELILRSDYKYIRYKIRIEEKSVIGKLKEFFQLRYFGNREVKINNIHYRTEVKSSCATGKESSNVTLYDSLSSVLQVWNEKILLMFDNGAVQMYNYDLKPVEHEINKLSLVPKDLINKRYIVVHQDIIFILDEGTSSNVLGKKFVVIVGNQAKSYQPLPELGGEITAVLYHAGTLFIGSADGILHIFTVNSDLDLLLLDLSQPHYEFNVTEDCTEPIIALAIQEDTNAHFYLAVASINKVFLISSNDLDIL